MVLLLLEPATTLLELSALCVAFYCFKKWSNKVNRNLFLQHGFKTDDCDAETGNKRELSAVEEEKGERLTDDIYNVTELTELYKQMKKLITENLDEERKQEPSSVRLHQLQAFWTDTKTNLAADESLLRFLAIIGLKIIKAKITSCKKTEASAIPQAKHEDLERIINSMEEVNVGSKNSSQVRLKWKQLLAQSVYKDILFSKESHLLHLNNDALSNRIMRPITCLLPSKAVLSIVDDLPCTSFREMSLCAQWKQAEARGSTSTVPWSIDDFYALVPLQVKFWRRWYLVAFLLLPILFTIITTIHGAFEGFGTLSKWFLCLGIYFLCLMHVVSMMKSVRLLTWRLSWLEEADLEAWLPLDLTVKLHQQSGMLAFLFMYAGLTTGFLSNRIEAAVLMRFLRIVPGLLLFRLFSKNGLIALAVNYFPEDRALTQGWRKSRDWLCWFFHASAAAYFVCLVSRCCAASGNERLKTLLICFWVFINCFSCVVHLSSMSFFFISINTFLRYSFRTLGSSEKVEVMGNTCTFYYLSSLPRAGQKHWILLPSQNHSLRGAVYPLDEATESSLKFTYLDVVTDVSVPIGTNRLPFASLVFLRNTLRNALRHPEFLKNLPQFIAEGCSALPILATQCVYCFLIFSYTGLVLYFVIFSLSLIDARNPVTVWKLLIKYPALNVLVPSGGCLPSHLLLPNLRWRKRNGVDIVVFTFDLKGVSPSLSVLTSVLRNLRHASSKGRLERNPVYVLRWEVEDNVELRRLFIKLLFLLKTEKFGNVLHQNDALLKQLKLMILCKPVASREQQMSIERKLSDYLLGLFNNYSFDINSLGVLHCYLLARVAPHSPSSSCEQLVEDIASPLITNHKARVAICAVGTSDFTHEIRRDSSHLEQFHSHQYDLQFFQMVDDYPEVGSTFHRSR